MKYALLILQCSSAIVLAAAGGLSGGSTGGGGIAGVGGGSSSSGTVTNLTGTNGITVTAGDPIVIGQDGTLATVAGLTTVSNQAANTRAAVYSPTYGLFGLAIKGGDGFPPTTNEQQARAIFSSDGAQWAGGTGLPVLYGLNGTLRDPAMYQVGDSYILSHTTNAIVSGSFLPSSGFPIYQSSNLLHWTFKTNLTFTLPGETLVAASNFCWSPVFHVSGATNYLLASVSTNNATSFEIRYRFAHTNDMVNGWGTTFRLDNQTGVTNLIDLTPFTDDDGITYAWYKNETDNYIELGRFDAGITSTFRPVLTNNHALWGANCEGNWMIKLPNGNYRLFFSRYQGKTYGNNGDGETLLYTESTSPTNWPSSGGQPITTNVVIGFYAQSFKPLVLRTAKAVADAVAATMSGQTFKGRINIDSEMRTSITKYGYASAQASGVPFTNDYAGINLGHGNFGQGMFGMGDGSLHFYTRTFDPADTNQFIFSYAKTFLRANSNSITTYLPLSSTLINPVFTNTAFDNVTAPLAPTNAYSAIQAALDRQGFVSLTMPGVYVISNAYLQIKSDTYFFLGKGVTLRRDGNTNALLINYSAGTVSNYFASSNIVIDGGIWDCNQSNYPTNATTIAIGHANNITVKNARFRNGASAWHQLEINGSQNCVVENCTFEGGSTTEDLQIDTLIHSGAFPWFGPYDDTICDRIYIRNNVFLGGTNSIGSHTAPTAFHKNLFITGNSFTNITGNCIKPYKWNDVVLDGNTGQNLYRFVYCDWNGVNGGANWTNWVIRNNNMEWFTNRSDGQSRPLVLKYIKSGSITGNTFRNISRHGIGLDDFSSDWTVANNVVENCGLSGTGRGIYLFGANSINVVGNRILGAVDYSIYLGGTTAWSTNLFLSGNLTSHPIAIDTCSNSVVIANSAVTRIATSGNETTTVQKFDGSGSQFSGAVTAANGLVSPSNGLSFATAAGLFTNGSHWIGTISNQLWAGYMTNNVAIFTNLWGHP